MLKHNEFRLSDFFLSLVTRQQKQQQGNQLAKEADRLIKAFSALPVGADQVLNSSVTLSYTIVQSHQTTNNKNFCGLSVNIYFLCVFQRQRKIQKERLLNDFSAALNSFQRTQRQAANKEREFVARVRASSRVSVSNLL